MTLTNEIKMIVGVFVMVLLAIVLVVLCKVAENESDNELYKQAIERGCSVINEEILCPGVAR